MKDRNKRKLIIYGLLGVLMLTTVAYASLQTILNVSGTVVKKGNLWNIYFTNPSSASIVGTATGSSLNIQASSLNFQVSLYKPGDKVTYTVDIKNGGTIDAVLNSISLTGLDTAKSNSLNYTVTYSDGSTIKEGDTLNVGANKTLKITVEFDSNATSIPESDVNLTFGVTLIYEQTTGSSSTGTSGITSNNVIAGIYGESIQNGTPTPTSPVEIESVGEKTKNLLDISDFNASFTDSYYIDTKTDFILKPSTKYVLSFDYKINSATADVKFGVGYGTNAYSNDIVGSSDYLKQDSGRNTVEFTTPDDIGNDKYLAVRFARTRVSASVNVDISSIQLEEGSTATSYEPYGYRIPITVSNGTDTKTTNIYLKEPLRKIGEYADYLDLTNKKVVRNVKEYVFTGTETVTNFSGEYDTTNRALFGYYAHLESVGEPEALSNYFKWYQYPNSVQSKIDVTGFNFHPDQQYRRHLYFKLEKSLLSTSDETGFKSWLTTKYNSGEPVLVDYILSAPTEESVDVPDIPSLTGNVTYSVGTSIKPSSINYTTR